MIYIVVGKALLFDLLRRQVFRQLMDDGADHFKVSHFLCTHRSSGNGAQGGMGGQGGVGGQAGFQGFLVHAITTMDKVLKYGGMKRKECREQPVDHPAVVGRGSERTINFYVV